MFSWTTVHFGDEMFCWSLMQWLGSSLFPQCLPFLKFLTTAKPTASTRFWSWRMKKRCRWDIEWKRIPTFGESHPGGVLGTNHHSAAIRPYILFAENPERKKHAIVTSLSLDHFKKLQRLSLRFSPCGCDLMRQTLGKSWIKDCWGWLFHEHGAIPADMCSAHCYWTTIQAAVEGMEVSSETAAFCQQKLRFLRNVQQNCPSVSRAKLFFTETFGFKFHLSNGSIIHLFHVRAWNPVQW